MGGEHLRPVAGVDYPRTFSEFVTWFPDQEACVAYLERLRWRDGFVCPGCGSERCWPASTGLGARVCGDCAKRTTVTAGTVFAGTRKPLTEWFAAAWYVCSTKQGVSALGLQNVLGLGSYATAWSWLHKLRRAMVIPGRDLLSGDVEVDETLVGGPEGAQGRRLGRKALVVVGAECRGTGSGRVRLARIPDASRASLHGFIAATVEEGATILTDGWPPYRTIDTKGYGHRAVSIAASAETASELLPRVHRVASLLKRWLLATHQGAVEPEHLDYYLDEFTFRFNRRRSQSRGLLFYRLLEQAVNTAPQPYASLAKGIKPGQGPRTPKHKM